MKKTVTLAWIILAAAFIVGDAVAAPYVVLRNGRRVDGTAIRALQNGDINLTTHQGIQTFPKGSYTMAVADKPAEYDQAVAAMRAGKHDAAIKLLENIVTRYRYLNWDVEAAKLLPQALLGKGDAEGAVTAYTKLFTLAPAQKKDSDLAWGMRKALLAAKQFPALTRELDAVTAAGSRLDAARAQIMRGDIQVAQNNLDQAVLDYLRTAILFQDIKDPAIQGEAHFKAAQALEKMREPRAKDMYRRLVEKYPSAPQAAQAKAKL
ncbi:MAG: tetratricopeptide repeat protein [Kiritimatiellae bacterium]|nr:tetratricopeptide repeat protein [Kiritimatiellia bacterium]MDD4341842.1 tetratricopeptide repeat protein [Kiritimatiellia bacterium]